MGFDSKVWPGSGRHVRREETEQAGEGTDTGCFLPFCSGKTLVRMSNPEYW